MFDARGLHLLVQPSGNRLWRLKYRYLGKEQKLALGTYPEVSLKEAREKVADARRLLAAGTNPAAAKRAAKIAATVGAANTFKLIGEEYISKRERDGRAASTVSKLRWLLSLLTPSIGHVPVADVPPAELLAALRKVEGRGRLETARRLRMFASNVFRYAIVTARASFDPADTLIGALATPTHKHHAAILDPDGVGALLRSIDGFDGQPATKLALLLAPHVFVRPGDAARTQLAFHLTRS